MQLYGNFSLLYITHKLLSGHREQNKQEKSHFLFTPSSLFFIYLFSLLLILRGKYK